MMERDLSFWRAIRNSLASAMEARRVAIGDADLVLVTRFLMESLEEKGLKIVPTSPSKEMVMASREALADGKRMNTSWVGEKTKHRWRIAAAIAASPDWKRGWDSEVR
jgi:hypothetical protein